MMHIENLPHVIKHGITHKNSIYANPNYIPIGDQSLINTRSQREVSITNGKMGYGFPTIILGDFIPFYFGVRMPMLFIVQNGLNFVSKATAQQDIIYVVCSLAHLISMGYNYYFSDGHAINNFTTFYDSTSIENISEIINWNAVKESYWGNEDNLDLKNKKQAEFLVGNDISPNDIAGYVCYNQLAKDKLVEMGVTDEAIRIHPNSYY